MSDGNAVRELVRTCTDLGGPICGPGATAVRPASTGIGQDPGLLCGS